GEGKGEQGGVPMPRLAYFTGLALLLVAGAFLLTDALLWEPGVTARNARLVKPGMTLAQVERVLGGPAAGWADWLELSASRAWPPPVAGQGRLGKWAGGRGGAAWVRVGRSGRVESVQWTLGPFAP